MQVEDGRIEYIKDSLDALHTKVDVIYKDADLRLKSLEEDRAHQKGMYAALTAVGGVIGSAFAAITTYFIFKDPT